MTKLISLGSFNDIQLGVHLSEGGHSFGSDVPQNLLPFISRMRNNWVYALGHTLFKENFTKHSLKRAKIRQCLVKQCTLDLTAATSSDWSSSKLKDCKLSSSNFQFSIFKNCRFWRTLFSNSSFYDCDLRQTKLLNSEIIGCSFTNSNFSNSRIFNLKISSSSLEDSIFNGSILRNINLSNTNIEYCDLTNCYKREIKMSLWQFPYVYGITTEDIQNESVLISSPDKSGKISWADLFDLIPSLIQYFEENNSYFPCANLLLISNHKDFKSYLNKAFKYNLLNFNPRELFHFCKLAKYSSQYSSYELSELYNLILRKSSSHEDTLFYPMYDGRFKSLLLKEAQSNAISLGIKFCRIEPKTNQLECIKAILDALNVTSQLLNFDVTFDSFTVSKNSPEKLTIENLTININPHKKKERNTIAYVSLLVTITLGIPTFINNLKELDLPHVEYEKLDECSAKVRKLIHIDDIVIERNGKNCINYEDNRISNIYSA